MTAPFDRIKIHIQVATKKESLRETWKSLMKNGGIRGLWRGNGINVTKIGPEMAIRFGVHDKIKSLLNTSNGEHISTYHRFMSGAIAGACGQIAIYPIEVLKTRMMVGGHNEFPSARHAVFYIYRKEGFRAFYRGYLASVIGMLPYTGVDLTVYELLKNNFILNKLEVGEKPSIWKLLTCACISITMGQFSSYPLYLIKARQQANSKHKSVIIGKKRPMCIICNTLASIVRYDGIFGLYRGVFLTLTKVLPAGVINYVIFESAKHYLGPYFSP